MSRAPKPANDRYDLFLTEGPALGTTPATRRLFPEDAQLILPDGESLRARIVSIRESGIRLEIFEDRDLVGEVRLIGAASQIDATVTVAWQVGPALCVILQEQDVVFGAF